MNTPSSHPPTPQYIEDLVLDLKKAINHHGTFFVVWLVTWYTWGHAYVTTYSTHFVCVWERSYQPMAVWTHLCYVYISCTIPQSWYCMLKKVGNLWQLLVGVSYDVMHLRPCIVYDSFHTFWACMRTVSPTWECMNVSVVYLFTPYHIPDLVLDLAKNSNHHENFLMV